MVMKERRSFILFGAFFAAWLGITYTLVSQGINQLALPGIPLASPAGSLIIYVLQYALVGGLLGAIIALPESRWAGVLLGGIASAAMIIFLALTGAWSGPAFGDTAVITLLFFMPLIVLMMPVALVVRAGVDAQRVDPARPYLWPRRFLIPLLMTLVAAGAGILSLFSPEIRAGFRAQDQMVQEGLRAPGENALPAPLKDVTGFKSAARGPYTHAWSDRLDTFMGPVPAGNELSQFLIITRFADGFSFACVYSSNRSVPTCTNYR